MVHMKRVIEVNASQHREHQRLQESDKKFEAGEGNQEGERRPSANEPEAEDEAREDLQHRVSRHHVGEETHRVADRTDEIGDELDWNDDGHQPDGNAGWREQAQVAGAVADEPMTVTVIHTIAAKANVTMMSLVL